MNPGTFSFCNGCRHRDVEMHRQGHPSPCGRQRWIGPKLHRPEISAAGCADFEMPEPNPLEGPPGDSGPIDRGGCYFAI